MTFKERYLEENQKVSDAVGKWRTGDITNMVPLLNVGFPGMLGNTHAGYRTGRELGHPIMGALIGPEGAAGARSIKKGDTSIGDVYSLKNLTKRMAQGGVAGATASIPATVPLSQMDPETAKTVLALYSAVGAGAGALTPAVKYGMGKYFGPVSKV